MMESPFEKIASLLETIKDKRKTVESQTNILKSFNLRMEILLECFKAYSFEEDKNEKEENIKKIKTNKPKEESSLELPIEKSMSVEERLSDILKSHSVDLSLRETALKMFQFIENKGTANLDEIVKSVKCSRYKIIEILNVFIKEKIVMKSFDKGFIYKCC